MPTYNHDDFDPPAPVALVDLRDQATGKTVAHIPMLMDTGADVTLVPQAALDRLQLAPTGETTYELAPLQEVRTFGKTNGDAWRNVLILGDNPSAQATD